MKMEVDVAVPSSYLSAPSSPRPFSDPASNYYYTSAPASPSRVAAIYTDFYGWEEKPVSPKPGRGGGAEPSDLDFCFYGQSEEEWTAAEELFEGGMIRPLMPSSAKNGGGGVKGEGSSNPSVMTMKEALRRDRGRTLSSSSSSSPSASSRGRRGSRSLSPLREGEGDLQSSPISSSPTVTSTSTLMKSGGSKKWKLKDLFLFRSASEGRATESKDPLRKYTFLPSSSSSSLYNKRAEDDGGSTRRGTSAHETYYSANRAASEEQKKKTPLPYHRHGLFGYLRHNPAIHSIKKGFSGSFSRS